MSSFHLRIYFAGLCWFEPHNGQLHALIVNGEKLERVPADYDRTHTAVLQFDPREATNASPDQSFPDIEDLPKSLWLLDQEILTLSPNARLGTRRLEFTPLTECKGQFPESEDQAKAFEWVGDIWGEGGVRPRLKPAVLEPERDCSLRHLLQASVRLDAGRMSAASFCHIRDDYILWEMGKGEPRALASVVECEIEVLADEIEIIAKKFDGSGARALRLRPLRPGDDVEIWIMNRKLQNVTEQQIFHQPGNDVFSQTRPAFAEYQAYYRLLENAPANPCLYYFHSRASNKNRTIFAKHCRDKSMNYIFFPKRRHRKEASGGMAPCSPAKGGNSGYPNPFG